MKPDAIPKIALHWTTDGKKKPGHPKETWKKSAERGPKTDLKLLN